MSENELLVLAAKAAGHEVEVVGNTVWINGDYHSARNTRPWNPLLDDAEALRLAVKLSLALDPCGECADVTIRGSHHEVLSEINFVDGDDKMPHVRRAIVLAAASIAK